ncbi:hypothetical protein A2872_03030 [Candidatus Gottesmanbacteria bacterium RIFCSPHIGHO2_01_FULL_42_12]|uniref:DUF7768 domain-containing protein n=1 Tax=Candidatus Gottesmanbacteria bacterium RIFCSPHIGHO2_01_FULL_42_12 TaxID=1798377 RepID=A0A1F5Z095_9BACT|nr:MAG: hypothetical protein A2872_03030 [Candidatus Gottesmanbacteria bacterium RIFCSPHIGHO2_01_FULL_42_12]
MSKIFKHGTLELKEVTKIIFVSSSKRNFYLRNAVSAFVLQNGGTPISPFMNFDYNLSGVVDKELIRVANNTMIAKSDEVWVFGAVSDGVLVEIYLTKKEKKKVRYFVVTGTTFKEITEENVALEDVSPWMWEWVLANKTLERWHPRLRFKKTYPLVYPAYSKRNFYWQMHISQFCLEKRFVPLNPFMLFRYFLGDTVERKLVYQGNNNIVRISDELWIFGEVSDGVLAEIKMKKEKGGKVKYFKVAKSNPVRFRQIGPNQVVFEEKELELYRNLL